MEQGTRHYNKQHILELIKTANAKHLRVRRTATKLRVRAIAKTGECNEQRCIATAITT